MSFFTSIETLKRLIVQENWAGRRLITSGWGLCCVGKVIREIVLND